MEDRLKIVYSACDPMHAQIIQALIFKYLWN